MLYFLRCLFFINFIFFSFISYSQDSNAYTWNVTSKKISNNEYELIFSSPGNKNWQLYAPNQILSEVATTELKFSDSAIQKINDFKDSGAIQNIQSSIFEIPVKLYAEATSWRHTIKIDGAVPQKLIGSLFYSYGKDEEFYQGEFSFSVPLEGGVSSTARILIPSIDLKINGFF